ncbi:MAG: transglutaminase family protein, partial [Bifidobacteriaceae bacterium]|nr:transglutaminase family protein [Bifidobacteriaceae bacterium]
MNRLRVRHIAGFRYPGGANASYNEARMLPGDSEGQLVLNSSLGIMPHAAQFTYTDYWGTPVTMFEVLSAHTELTLTATCLVELRRDDAGSEPPSATWEDVRRLAVPSARLVEQSRQTGRTRPAGDVSRLAADIARQAATPHAAGIEICAAVRSRIDYVKGVTGVNSTAREAWDKGRGVCQDIAHVALGALRSVGIPARYVSGYQHPDAQPEPGVT